MNNGRLTEIESHKSLQILNELSDNDSLTQRDLSGRLGIALGLVNSYIRNLVSKGFITVKSIPPRRYAYFLTPEGFAEKTRLTYDLLQDYTRIYREARSGFKGLFSELGAAGINSVVFAGADETAEIAYITSQEMDMVLSGVIDEDLAGRQFFGRNIMPFSALQDMEFDCVIVASYLKREKIHKQLRGLQVPEEMIKTVF